MSIQSTRQLVNTRRKLQMLEGAPTGTGQRARSKSTNEGIDSAIAQEACQPAYRRDRSLRVPFLEPAAGRLGGGIVQLPPL